MRKLDYFRKQLRKVKSAWQIDISPFMKPDDADVYLSPLTDPDTHLNIGIVIQHYKIYDDDPEGIEYIDEIEKYILPFPDRLKKDNVWFWH